MFDSFQKSVRTRYTATVALLLMAVVLSPIVLFASPSLEYISVLGAVAFSALCGAMAWNQWKWHANDTVPSITKQAKEAK